MFCAALVILTAAAVPVLSVAEPVSVIRGRVLDCRYKLPVKDARIDYLSTSGFVAVLATTDADGRYVRVGVEPGTYTLVASSVMTSFSHATTVRIDPGDIVVLDFRPQRTGPQPNFIRCDPYAPVFVETSDRYNAH
jgi:hypothetical protein